MPDSNSLYDCFQAKVISKKVLCDKGHVLSGAWGSVSIIRVQRGDPLRLAACQGCKDYLEMDGGPVPGNEKGWAHQGASVAQW